MPTGSPVPNGTSNGPSSITNIVLESCFRQVFGMSNPEVELSKLQPLLLDQLVVLGQTAQQLKQVFSPNGHNQINEHTLGDCRGCYFIDDKSDMGKI